MFTKEQTRMELKGIEVQDALALLQIIRRLVKSGAVEDIELAPLAGLRSKLIGKIQEATGVNHDQVMAQRARRNAAVPMARAGNGVAAPEKAAS